MILKLVLTELSCLPDFDVIFQDDALYFFEVFFVFLGLHNYYYTMLSPGFLVSLIILTLLITVVNCKD